MRISINYHATDTSMYPIDVAREAEARDHRNGHARRKLRRSQVHSVDVCNEDHDDG